MSRVPPRCGGLLVLALLAGAAGCSGPRSGDVCDGDAGGGRARPTWYADVDGDGFGGAAVAAGACEPPDGAVSVSGDCDDHDPAAWPGASETCDGRDHDCDGYVDDPTDPAGYADRDGDGYGAADQPVAACPGEPGVVADATDCDDGLAGVHPGAGETCRLVGVDDDCDGLVDDADAEVEDQALAWPDADGDGFGDAASASIAACVRPDGYAPDATDCDDADPATHPGAPEVCDGLDNDCDGRIDGNDRVGVCLLSGRP